MKKLGFFLVTLLFVFVLVGCPNGTTKSPFAGMTFKQVLNSEEVFYCFSEDEITVKINNAIYTIYSYTVDTKAKEITLKNKQIVLPFGENGESKLCTFEDVENYLGDQIKMLEETIAESDNVAYVTTVTALLDEAKKTLAEAKETFNKPKTETYTFDGKTLILKEKQTAESYTLTKI